MNSVKKDLVLDFMKGLATGTPDPISFIGPEKYVQHNLSAPDGVEGFKGMLSHLPPGAIQGRVVRIFEEGDFVFSHTEYEFFGPKIGFDIFRFENGKVVEHWDNMQKTAPPNASGHTMTDGATDIKDADKTMANKELVKNFITDMFLNGRMDQASKYIKDDIYIQHNPQIGDGFSGLGAAFMEMAKHGMMVKLDKLHKVLGEGNFVLTVSEGKIGEQAMSFYDLFRVEDGRIVEHWDVLESIPAQTEWKNTNGKFGF